MKVEGAWTRGALRLWANPESSSAVGMQQGGSESRVSLQRVCCNLTMGRWRPSFNDGDPLRVPRLVAELSVLRLCSSAQGAAG